jgi:hypothetical protein
MARVINFEKYNSIYTSNEFLSNGKFQQKAGSLKLGTSNDFNYNGNSNTVIAVGSAYTQGNVVRSLFDLNDNGPYLYNSTEYDDNNIKSKFDGIFLNYPSLNDYPYLYPISETWTSNTVIENSKEFPIFSYSGKGVGKITFRTNGGVINGNLCQGEPKNIPFYDGKAKTWHSTVGKIPEQPFAKNIDGPTWPYTGKLYSGHLVQLHIELQNEFDKEKYTNVKIIPYQAGRGIPQWDATQEYFGGIPFGVPIWPNTTLEMKPVLSIGCAPGNNDACLGVSLSTELTQPKSVIYKYQIPSGFDTTDLERDPHIPWNQHPAPFTAPPENISFTRIPRIYSPGPNLSDTYWAPWPDYYAYQHNQEVPVLGNGQVTVKIGAAFNIGMQAYYEPDVEEGDNPINNPKYVSVSTVPLFQGEKVKVGSYLYANAMGHVITYDQQGINPYPSSCLSESGTSFPFDQRDGRSGNPWYDWYDPTFGATGWTSTPQFLLTSVPDMGTAIIETKNGVVLPYLSQANQGSSIVHAVTTKNPIDEDGSGRMILIGPETFDKPPGIKNPNDGSTVPEDCVEMKFANITKFTGIPDRSLSIGHMLQEIEGTGRWNYTGKINMEQSVFSGPNWWPSSAVGQVLTTTSRTGSGIGALIIITSIDSGGTVDGINITSIGSGYQDGEILIANNLISPMSSISLHTMYSPITIIYNISGGGLVSVSLFKNGTNYKSESGAKTFNLTANNILVRDPSVTHNIVQTNEEYNRYPPGTAFYVITENSNLLSDAALGVLENDGTGAIFITNFINIPSIIFPIQVKGSLDTYNQNNGSDALFNTQHLDQKNPVVTIQTNSNGSIQNINVTDMGRNNRNGDLILVRQPGSDQNCIFIFNNDPENITNLTTIPIKGGYGYNQYTYIYSGSTTFINDIIFTSSVIDADGNYLGRIIINSLEDLNIIEKLNTNILNETYTGKFGDIQTVSQSYLYFEDQPNTGGTKISSPSNGWPNYNIIKNATFYQKPVTQILDGGNGYSVGESFSVTGGTGTGMKINILEVKDGVITCIDISDIGNYYSVDDEVTIVGGNNNSNILLGFYANDNNGFSPQIGGSFSIGGTGYTPGFYTTINLSGTGTGMIVEVLTTSPLTDPISPGTVLTIKITNNGTGYINGGSVQVVGGDNNYNFIINVSGNIINQLTSGGTKYKTANGVPTRNLSQNNFFPLCNLNGGTCIPSTYLGDTINPPMRWDFSRYQVGDVLKFNQNGNISASAEIASINESSQAISWTNINPGAGYITPTSTDYGFVPTINTSIIESTANIISDSGGQVTSVRINLPVVKTRIRYGDYIEIQQVGSNNNVVVQLNQETIGIPPSWQPFINGRNATATEWNDYKQNMKSAVNLLDKTAIIDLYNCYPEYMNNSWYWYGDGGIENDPYEELLLCSIL